MVRESTKRRLLISNDHGIIKLIDTTNVIKKEKKKKVVFNDVTANITGKPKNETIYSPVDQSKIDDILNKIESEQKCYEKDKKKHLNDDFNKFQCASYPKYNLVNEIEIKNWNPIDKNETKLVYEDDLVDYQYAKDREEFEKTNTISQTLSNNRDYLTTPEELIEAKKYTDELFYKLPKSWKKAINIEDTASMQHVGVSSIFSRVPLLKVNNELKIPYLTIFKNENKDKEKVPMLDEIYDSIKYENTFTKKKHITLKLIKDHIPLPQFGNQFNSSKEINTTQENNINANSDDSKPKYSDYPFGDDIGKINKLDSKKNEMQHRLKLIEPSSTVPIWPNIRYETIKKNKYPHGVNLSYIVNKLFEKETYYNSLFSQLYIYSEAIEYLLNDAFLGSNLVQIEPEQNPENTFYYKCFSKKVEELPTYVSLVNKPLKKKYHITMEYSLFNKHEYSFLNSVEKQKWTQLLDVVRPTTVTIKDKITTQDLLDFMYPINPEKYEELKNEGNETNEAANYMMEVSGYFLSKRQ